MSKPQQLAIQIITKFCNENTFRPDRIVAVDNDAVLLSWFGEHKYAEIEIQKNGEINAWISFEIGTPETFAVCRNTETDVEININSALMRIQEFLS